MIHKYLLLNEDATQIIAVEVTDKDSDQPVHFRGLLIFFAVFPGNDGTFMSTGKNHISLHGGAGCSELSLVAYITRYIFSIHRLSTFEPDL